ncbi:MAG TPA: DUF655 domain-containing protein [Candidatus Diapherotrites archaeon]|uniref:DUF655 domain-containing protein n=1 Tax=Candidatus Iainarchaeum sp. TaxID=3101447 RepID=A0A7J4JKG2_9ARCH|nr:DUF655 domain-containing protein [Candidatus Diapherotrites archaeon]HIH16815.1 DUF655 domain-containing protein [Candidatus Diapherotrites archaeon]
MQAEERAIVLDYLPRGKSTGYKTEPLAQLLGTSYFTLLEVVPKADLKIQEEVYVGKDERDKIDYIKRRVPFKELTNTAQMELEKAVEKLVKGDEAKYVAFFNQSRPITIKRHQLELLPGLGKKHLFCILEEREKTPFASFEDLVKRVHLMPDPVKLIIKRVVDELEREDVRHYLFSRPPSQAKPLKRF